MFDPSEKRYLSSCLSVTVYDTGTDYNVAVGRRAGKNATTGSNNIYLGATRRKPIQYGLIAVEVADMFPDLVVQNEDSEPETVTGLLGGHSLR